MEQVINVVERPQNVTLKTPQQLVWHVTPIFVHSRCPIAFQQVRLERAHVNVEVQQLVEQPIKLVIDVPHLMLRGCACVERVLFVRPAAQLPPVLTVLLHRFLKQATQLLLANAQELLAPLPEQEWYRQMVHVVRKQVKSNKNLLQSDIFRIIPSM